MPDDYTRQRVYDEIRTLGATSFVGGGSVQGFEYGGRSHSVQVPPGGDVYQKIADYINNLNAGGTPSAQFTPGVPIDPRTVPKEISGVDYKQTPQPSQPSIPLNQPSIPLPSQKSIPPPNLSLPEEKIGTSYTVKPNDTLSKIAKQFGVTINDISGYRSGNPNLIFPGENLTIKTPPITPQKRKEIIPTASIPSVPSTILPAPTPTFFDILKESGFSLEDNSSLEDVIKQVSSSFGITEINNEIKGIDNKFAEDVSSVNDNPWLSESLRSKKIISLQEKYERKKNSLVDRLKLQEDVVGKAIDIYYKERDLKKDILLKAFDVRSKQIEDQIKTTDTIREYNFASAQGYSGSFNDFLKERKQIPASILLQTGAVDRLLTPGEAADFGVPYGTMASEVKGLIPLGTTERGKLTEKSSALATLDEIEKISQKVNTFGPGFFGINRLLEGGKLTVGALTQTNPDAAQLVGQVGILATIIRGLGEKGTLATADVERALALIPKLTTTSEVAERNIKEIRNILESSKEAVISGAKFKIGDITISSDPLKIR